jgi:hypothetical protein
VAYKDPETGAVLEYFPADLGFLERCEVVYHEMEGWQQPTTQAKTFVSLRDCSFWYGNDLTHNRRTYQRTRRLMLSSSKSIAVFPWPGLAQVLTEKT